MPLKAIVFDFDGVIANSEPLHYRAYRDVLAPLGVALSEADYYARYLGYDDVGAFAKISEDRGLAWTADRIATLVADKACIMEALERDVSVLFPGASDAVRRAAALAPLAIASGALRVEIERVLVREGLSRYFPIIVSAEDTPRSKPAPDPYLRVIALLTSSIGAAIDPRDCIAIEDSPWGLQSARAAGLRTIGVAHSYAESGLTGADWTVCSIADLDIAAIAI